MDLANELAALANEIAALGAQVDAKRKRAVELLAGKFATERNGKRFLIKSARIYFGLFWPTSAMLCCLLERRGPFRSSKNTSRTSVKFCCADLPASGSSRSPWGFFGGYLVCIVLIGLLGFHVFGSPIR